jgi:hypothetical protein
MPGEGHRPDIESEAHKQRIAFIDATSGVDDRARDIAEARLIEEQDTLRHEGGFRNFFKRIWKSKMQEYYRVKEVQKLYYDKISILMRTGPVFRILFNSSKVTEV